MNQQEHIKVTMTSIKIAYVTSNHNNHNHSLSHPMNIKKELIESFYDKDLSDVKVIREFKRKSLLFWTVSKAIKLYQVNFSTS